MNVRQQGWLQQAGHYALFTLAAAALTAFYRSVLHANQATVALSFLILILFTAFRRRLAYSIYLSLLCTLLYNYYFLPPIGSLTVADPQNLVALVAFLVAAVSVNHVSAREHRHAEALAEHQLEVEKLYEFSQRLLLEDRLQQLADSIPKIIAECFNMRAVALYMPDHETPSSFDPEHLLPSAAGQLLESEPEDLSKVPADAARDKIRLVPLSLGMRSQGSLGMAGRGYSESLYDAIGSLTAITMERAAAMDRNNRSEAAREGERLRAALLDSITHELRTPLTGIRIAATTLMSGASLDQASILDLATVISEESVRLDRLIGEAIIAAKLSAGEVHVSKQPADICEVIQHVLQDLEGSLRGRAVILQCEDAARPVAMDPGLMRRVWKHLIENAVQYSPARSPITIRAHRTDESLVMSVENEGKGIPEHEQTLVFNRFFRGANRVLHTEGTGMGLAIVKAIIEAHQGSIHVRSRGGTRTIFEFYIPLQPGTDSVTHTGLKIGSTTY